MTICTRDRINILSEVIKTDSLVPAEPIGITVGDGLAPPEVTYKNTPTELKSVGVFFSCQGLKIWFLFTKIVYIIFKCVVYNLNGRLSAVYFACDGFFVFKCFVNGEEMEHFIENVSR